MKFIEIIDNNKRRHFINIAAIADVYEYRSANPPKKVFTRIVLLNVDAAVLTETPLFDVIALINAK